MLPSAAETASASQRCKISELNLHGLLPCCVRFGTHQSPGEWQHSLPACSLALTGRDLHPLDFIKWFPLLHCRFLHFHAYPSAICRCLTSCTMLPSSHPAHRTGYADFPLPALGERVTMSPTGKVAHPFGEADETQHVVQGCLGKPLGPRHHFVLGTQPLAQPLAGVAFHSPI